MPYVARHRNADTLLILSAFMASCRRPPRRKPRRSKCNPNKNQVVLLAPGLGPVDSLLELSDGEICVQGGLEAIRCDLRALGFANMFGTCLDDDDSTPLLRGFCVAEGMMLGVVPLAPHALSSSVPLKHGKTNNRMWPSIVFRHFT